VTLLGILLTDARIADTRAVEPQGAGPARERAPRSAD
jgi:hypothetical protein